MSLDLTGIHNVGEFYSHHYLEAVLGSDLADIFNSWRARETEDGVANPAKRFSGLGETFFKTKHQASQQSDAVERWRLARDFHVRLLETLGYEYEPGVEYLPDGEALPVLLSQDRDGRPFLWVMDAPFVPQEDDSALDLHPLFEQFSSNGESGSSEHDPTSRPQDSWRELLDGPIFKQENPPRWVMFLAGDEVLLIDQYKWGQGKYLRFALADLLSRKNKDALRATTALLHRSVLNPEEGVCHHDTLEEKNHKHAYAVSADLKYGARQAIELLGNEAIRYKRRAETIRLISARKANQMEQGWYYGKNG